MDWKALLTLDLKSVLFGAAVMAALGGTPVYFEREGLKLQLNGARNVAIAQAQALAKAGEAADDDVAPAGSAGDGRD